jgi:hypothetical protein
LTGALKGYDMQMFHRNVGVFSVLGSYLSPSQGKILEHSYSDNRNALRIRGKKRSFGRQEFEKKREGFVLQPYPQSKWHLCKTDVQDTIYEQDCYSTHETSSDTGNSVDIKTHGSNNSELLL